MIESLDNIRRGFPTPLPPWRDWSGRYITGIFAALIDFVFFLLPLLISGVLLFCVAVVFLVSNGATGWLSIVGVALLLYELAMFAIGVAPVARLNYVEQGSAEEALSMLPLRAALRPGARRVYARARLLSLPAYLPALLLLTLAWLAARQRHRRCRAGRAAAALAGGQRAGIRAPGGGAALWRGRTRGAVSLSTAEPQNRRTTEPRTENQAHVRRPLSPPAKVAY